MNKIILFFRDKKALTRILVSLLLSIIIVLFGSLVTSFVYRYSSTNLFVNDASMFYYMGKLFNAGKTPYVEIFDHKGLYIFYYTAFGAWAGKLGVMLVQILFNFIFFYFFLLCLKELEIKKEVVIIVLALFAILQILSTQSPSDFEPLYPFISSSFYFYIKGFRKEDKKSFLIGNLIAGLMTGMTINIRASDAMIPFSLVVFYFLYALKHKKLLSIIPNALICLLGITITILPPFLHAYFGGFFDLMIDSVILSNFRYVGSMPKGSSNQTISLIVLGLILVAYALMIFYSWKKKMFSSDEWLFYVVTFIISFIVQLALAYYIHYLFIWVPVLLIFLAGLINKFSFSKMAKTISVYTSLVILIVAASFNVINYYVGQYKVDQAIVTYVDETIAPEAKKGKVLGLMISASVYLNSNIVTDYPDFTAQHNHIRSSATYNLERLETYLLSGECTYVITQNNYTPQVLIDLVNEKLLTKYALITSDLPGADYINIYEYHG